MHCTSPRQALNQACPNSLAHGSNKLGRSWPQRPRTAPETYGLTPGASAAGDARDCRRGDGRAALMQVRPLSVVSGVAGSSPFGCAALGRSGWL